MFRLLITGSRDWQDYRKIWEVLNQIDAKLGSKPATLVHGGARGVDTIAASHWRNLNAGALKQGERLTELHEALWDRQGPPAGIRRNIRMVNAGANLCLAFIHTTDGKDSAGAGHCLKIAQRAGIKCLVWRE